MGEVQLVECLFFFFFFPRMQTIINTESYFLDAVKMPGSSN